MILIGGFHWKQASRPTRLKREAPEDIHKSLGNTAVLNRDVAFPSWAPVVLFAAWPIIAFLRGPYRRAARRGKGLCLECGYNLTGLVEPRCPECGIPTCPDKVDHRTSVSV